MSLVKTILWNNFTGRTNKYSVTHASFKWQLLKFTHLYLKVSKVELPTEEMKQTYPQVKGFFFVSSHTGQVINMVIYNLMGHNSCYSNTSEILYSKLA